MAQKHWETVLADNLEGGVSTEKALLDIKRGKGQLLSADGTIGIKPSGGVYDGIDLSVSEK